MKDTPILSGCMGMSRRGFLATGCAACLGAAGCASLKGERKAAKTAAEKMRIRTIYSLHAEVQPGPDWPNVGFDFRPPMERINNELALAFPHYEFLPALATGPEQAKKILEEDASKNIDGYIVYQMNCWNQVVQTIAASGKPVLYADFQYAGSGGFLVYTAAFLRANAPNVGFVDSSRMEDQIDAVKCFAVLKTGGSPQDFVAATKRLRLERTGPVDTSGCLEDNLVALSPEECLRRMKESRILEVEQGWGNLGPVIKQAMGIDVVSVKFAELNEAWKAAYKDQSREVADMWEKTAAKIEGVSRETLETSAAMYLAQKAVLQKYNANAITINCLGGFYGGHIHAYPCLGFHQLLNDGLIGACECDIRSTATMVALTAMTQGRPGFISDPVIDTSKGQIIYAHCVASNRAFGPAGPANPFEILTHSEDRQGASLRSKLPLDYMTTTVEFAPEPERKEILFHQGKAVENVVDDRACRTKLAVQPVGDLEKLFTEWDRWGWHRVTVHGDLKEPIAALADALGWKVTHEA